MKPHPAAAPPTKAPPKRAAAAPPAVAPDAGTASPSTVAREDFIRETAYYHFEARGCIGGHELEDWLRAEAEFERLHSDGTPKAEKAAPDSH
jgi:hypothetical protein